MCISRIGTRQYRAKEELFGSRLYSKEEERLLLNSRRGDSTQKEEELAGVTASSGYNQQRVLVRAKLFLEDQVLIFLAQSAQGSLRGNLCGFFDGENHRKPREKILERERKQVSSSGVVQRTNPEARKKEREKITRQMTY